MGCSSWRSRRRINIATDIAQEMKIIRQLLTNVMLAAALAGCTSSSPPEDVVDRIAQARDMAGTADMAEATVASQADFDVRVYSRVDNPGGVLHVYFEGDGAAFSRYGVSDDPTPRNPLALKLAALDPADNVAYIARPCQFVMSPKCHQGHWTTSRYAPDIIAASQDALQYVMGAASPKEIHMFGFSGGANVAGLITARRSDVTSLRTIAGNLDHVTLMARKRVRALSESLNVADEARQIAHVPQIHFVGEDDKTVPVWVAQSYFRKSGRSTCTVIIQIPDADHGTGWTKVWTRLLERPLPKC